MIPTYSRAMVHMPEDESARLNTEAHARQEPLQPTLVSEAERRQWLMEWNSTGAEYPRHLCLHQLLEQQLARTPHHPALAFEDQRLTYAEMHRRSNLLAVRLRALGAGPEVPVGLFVERSLEMVVGILGILKAGSAYVPIDPATPLQRVAFLLNDAGASLLLTQTPLLPAVPATAGGVITLDTFDWQCKADEDIAPGVHSGNLACLIYTSGSTGTPKGVCVEHRNLVNYVLGVSDRFRFEPGMQHAMVSTVAADLGNTVLFPSLATGGCLHIISRERAENPLALADYFEREIIDVLKITPSHLAALQAGRNPERVMPRRRLILGGEASRAQWVKHLRTMSPHCEIFNHYGPTEATVGVLTCHVGPNIPDTESGTLPLGKPLPNCRVYILDQQRQPQPAGTPGELWIGGAGVTRGYLHRANLTAESFLPDPFALAPGERMYRSGDRARHLPNGDIEFLGRADRQVKIRGHRVELGEVEHALHQQPGIREAVVTAVDHASESTQLIAHIVPTLLPQPLWANPSVYLLPDDSSVAHIHKSETDYIYKEIFVLQAYLRHGITVQHGDCIVDAGANIGLFTVFLSRLQRNLRIFSFEPNPAAFACLSANAAAWGENVTCLPFGLSHQNTHADMTVFEGFSLLSGFHADAGVEREVVRSYVHNSTPVPHLDEHWNRELGNLLDQRFRARNISAQLRTLSSVMEEEGIDHIDLLKINVEKCELEILQGLEDRHWPGIRQMVLEVDERHNLEPVTALLQKHGFQFLVEQDPLLRNTALCYVYARRGEPLVKQSFQQNSAGLPPPQPLAPGDRALTPAGLRKQLQSRLPPYMVPSQFVLLDELPLTVNGKIDRGALPAPSSAISAARQEFVGPRTSTEKGLAAIWQDLLSVDAVGVQDDFFDLGGNSLLAIRAVARIADEFGVDLPLATLLESPTIDALARKLEKDRDTPSAVSWSSLVPLRSTGSQPPLFLMHSHGGNTLEYRPLADLLGSNQPVYALQARGLDGHIPTNTTMQEMAAAYLQELRFAAPVGPYFLGGYCLGGLLALEAAQQLTAAGEKVALLILIQSMNPPTMQFRPDIPTPLRLWYRATQRLNLEQEYVSSRGWGFMAERFRFHSKRAWIKASIALDRTGTTRNSDLSHLPMHYALEALERVHQRVLKTYQPQPYSGDVLIIRAEKQPRGWIAGTDLGWNGLLHGNVDFVDLPGHQQNLLHSPNVAQLAEALRSRMAAARNRIAVSA